MAMLDTCNTQEVERNQGFAYANMHAFWTEEEPFVVRKAQQIIKNTNSFMIVFHLISERFVHGPLLLLMHH